VILVVEAVEFLYFAAFCLFLPFVTNWEEIGAYEFFHEIGKTVCLSKNVPVLFVLYTLLILMIFPGIILSTLLENCTWK